MPKSTKHKKARAADFAKAKLKLGKGKQIASNATNTSFSSRSIALPNQSLSDAPKSEPTSRRNLTLSELLVQLRHYSVPVKKEALVDIQHLLNSHQWLLKQQLLALIFSLSHLISSSTGSSPGLRQEAIKLLRWIFDQLLFEELASVSQGLILYTISALSSLDEGVRIDALSVLDLLLNRIPSEIVRGWDGSSMSSFNSLKEGQSEGKGEDEGTIGEKVIQALLGALRIRGGNLNGSFTTAATSSDLSTHSRLAILSTLSNFTKAALHPSSAGPVASTSSSSNTESPTPTSTPPWYLFNSFNSTTAYHAFVGFLSLSESKTTIPRSITQYQWDSKYVSSFMIEEFQSTSQFLDGKGAKSLALSSLTIPLYTASDATHKFPSASYMSGTSETLLSLLYPTLLSTFLDAAPTAFSPEPSIFTSNNNPKGISDPHLASIVAALSISERLFRKVLGGAEVVLLFDRKMNAKANDKEVEVDRREPARKMLLGFLAHVGVYFPFGSDSLTDRGRDVEQCLETLNLLFASMVSQAVLATPNSYLGLAKVRRETMAKTYPDRPQSLAKSSQKEKLDRQMETMVQNVSEWVISSLRGETVTKSSPLGVSLSAEAYTALEPTLWSLLNAGKATNSLGSQKANDSQDLLEAILEHFKKTGSGSEVKRRSFDFIARIIMIQTNPNYTGQFTMKGNVTPESTAGQWLLSLPKYLWEMGAKYSQATDDVLTFLLRIAQQGSKSLFDPKTLSALQAPLSSFFHLQHAARGSIPGPFVKHNPVIQRRALDLASYLLVDQRDGWETLKDSMDSAIALVSKRSVVSIL